MQTNSSKFSPPLIPLDTGDVDFVTASDRLARHELLEEFVAKYSLGEELGCGGFGFVMLATRLSDGLEVAVKFIFKDKVSFHGWVKDPVMGIIPTEVYVLRNVRHRNIIGFLDLFEDQSYFYLVMELHGTPWSQNSPLIKRISKTSPSCFLMAEQQDGPPADSKAQLLPDNDSFSGTSLPPHKQHLQLQLHLQTRSPPENIPQIPNTLKSQPVPRSTKAPAVTAGLPRPAQLIRRASSDLFECIEHHNRFSESRARMIFKQIAECVHYLDSKGICHRDIKDENIVIDKDFQVKLIDFGSAVIIPEHGHYFDRFYGTINYASPEILSGNRYQAESAEVWSLGILLYTILYGDVPFTDADHVVRHPYVQPRFTSTYECRHLLDWMLTKDPHQRATINDVIKHPWLVDEFPQGPAKSCQQ